MSERINETVIHYSANDPSVTTGGVETFARNLNLSFAGVRFMTPQTLDLGAIRRDRSLVVCDNHWVVDLPEDIPAVAFQHGVARVKSTMTRSKHDATLAQTQARAAKRENTLWVACARWISDRFKELHGNEAAEVIYHPVDLERFDGRREGTASRLLLHDARSAHKGRDEIAFLQREFPDWRFAGLNCKPSEVPDRMRSGAAFIHLSRYEGNSIVCNEAMAMNLPCLFSRVGLMQDRDQDFDVQIIDFDDAFTSRSRLREVTRGFLGSLEKRIYQPRRWCEANASLDAARAAWGRTVERWRAMSWG